MNWQKYGHELCADEIGSDEKDVGSSQDTCHKSVAPFFWPVLYVLVECMEKFWPTLKQYKLSNFQVATFEKYCMKQY